LTTDSRLLVERLARRLRAEVVETHISWVLLAGELAYKIKKPLRLPFVDYSTLELRQHFCGEEVRLNQRLAAALYLGVSRVSGPLEAPAFDGPGEILEYAVRMRRFPAGALFSEQAAAGTLSDALVDRFAGRLADFQAGAPVCAEPVDGTPTLGARTLAALAGSLALFTAGEQAALRAGIEVEAAGVGPLWSARRRSGHVREGHGDLHLANVLALQDEVLAFDCIEFDRALRCIDVIEEVAFPLMDFAARGQPAAGWRFLDAWLQRSGDYEGVAGLRLGLVYRALVRALVEHLREPHGALARRYASEALAWSKRRQAHLFITHGLPGSGKTFASQRVLERVGAIRIRSDVERKRLHGLQALADSRAHGLAVYTPEATRRTYERLFALAGVLLSAGWPVVLDAAFLREDERRAASALAQRQRAHFTILDCEAPLDLLRQRLQARSGDASEADLAALELLRGVAEPLQPDEQAFAAPPA
jgi:aminoglycoside phosphotransferase family enzyme/predicted kinase